MKSLYFFGKKKLEAYCKWRKEDKDGEREGKEQWISHSTRRTLFQAYARNFFSYIFQGVENKVKVTKSYQLITEAMAFL